MEEPFEPLLSSLSEFYTSSAHSDGAIQCGGKNFNIHKVVLAAQSKFFSKAYSGNWKESTNGTIDLKDDNVLAVEAMIQFMYTFNYDATGPEDNYSSPMVFNVKVYSLADKYEIAALRTLAREKFKTSAETCWDMDDFALAIAEVYASTPSSDRGLRQIVVDVSCEHVKELVIKHLFLDVLEGTSAFGADMVKAMADEPTNEKVKEYQCPFCAKSWEAVLTPGQNYYCIHCQNCRSDWQSFAVK